MSELSEIKDPGRQADVAVPNAASRGNTGREACPDGDSNLGNSFLGNIDDDDGGRHATASPNPTIPDVDEAGTEAAWMATTLPILVTSPELAVWEVSERYNGWLSQCHIKLGVAGAWSQTFLII